MTLKRRLLAISRADARSSVHRAARFYRVAVRRFDETGTITGEDRIIGLFAASAPRACSTHRRCASAPRKCLNGPDSSPTRTRRELRAVLESFLRTSCSRWTPTSCTTSPSASSGCRSASESASSMSEPGDRYVSCLVYPLPAGSRDRCCRRAHRPDGEGRSTAVREVEHTERRNERPRPSARHCGGPQVPARRPTLVDLESGSMRSRLSWTERLRAELVLALGEKAREIAARIDDEIPVDTRPRLTLAPQPICAGCCRPREPARHRTAAHQARRRRERSPVQALPAR